MKHRLAIAIPALLLSVNQSLAATSAEFLQWDRNFAMGFVLGIVSHEIDVLGDKSDPYIGPRIGKCLQASNIQLGTIYELSIAEAKAHPEEMSYPAVGSVIRTIRKICPGH
jgi:hypothetical protein